MKLIFSCNHKNVVLIQVLKIHINNLSIYLPSSVKHVAFQKKNIKFNHIKKIKEVKK